MPRKIRELIRELESAGFRDRGGKGSHWNFLHPDYRFPITISGREGDDAKPYQEKAAKQALKEVQK